jgi:hypothetical protein
MPMFQRLYQVREVTQETLEIATANKVAAIVATLVVPIISGSELDCRALPAVLKARLVGYLQGFCLPVWAAWQISDTYTHIAAARRVVASIVSEDPAPFLT